MTNQEAIETIEANYPPEKYSMLREALDIAIKAVQKHIPKEPVNFHKNYDEHEWRNNADGEPDEWAWMFDIHNGPVCERCGFSFCEGCNPHGWTAKKCYIDYYSCPECRNQIEKGDKFCKKCGQALQWDKFKKTVKHSGT